MTRCDRCWDSPAARRPQREPLPAMDEWVAGFAAAIVEVDPTADPDRAQAAMRWALGRGPQWDGRDEFEPVAEDWFDPGNEGADLLELRESRWREWEA